MNLENLTLIGNCLFLHLEFVLSNALRFGTQTILSDELFAKVFQRNELKHLEELRLSHRENCLRTFKQLQKP